VIVLDVIIAGLLTGGIYALLAAGFSLQYGVARVLNVSHGEFIMLGALAAYSLYVPFGINPLVSLAIVGPILFIIGFLINKILFERIRRLAGSIEVFEGWSILVSFGLLFIIQNVALLAWGPNEKGYTFLAVPINLLGAIFPANRLVALLIAVVIGLSFFLFLMGTRLGKAIRAASQEETGAQLIGVNIRWMHGLCFGLGALLAGLAGALISTMFTVSPFMGLPYTIIAIIVVVLGGLGNIMGSLVGGLILGLIGSIVLHIEPGLELAVLYLLFMLILLVRPKGIFGK
jgi:branched-chain amino acid transport system permease protein